MYECGGDTSGDPTWDTGAERVMGLLGGGIIEAAGFNMAVSWPAAAAAAAAICWALLLRLELGLL